MSNSLTSESYKPRGDSSAGPNVVTRASKPIMALRIGRPLSWRMDFGFLVFQS